MAPSNVENFSPHVIKQISRELCDLTQNQLEGVRVVFNEDDITNVQADVEGPAGTPYFGGLFRVRLVLGKNFPSLPPKGFFVTKIFHPNVGKNGEICVNTLKKDWNQDLGIKHILLTIKCLLIVPNPESALNEEAGKMLLEQYDDYCKRAKMMTEIHAPKATTGGTNQNKQPLDGVCCSEEPATKRLNNILDCYNSAGTDHEQPSSQQQKSITSATSQQSSSQSSNKISGTSTMSNKNRGLKRVLRLRS